MRFKLGVFLFLMLTIFAGFVPAYADGEGGTAGGGYRNVIYGGTLSDLKIEGITFVGIPGSVPRATAFTTASR